jgi:hypothetical protein
MAPRKRFARWGKSGALAKYVHRGADLHAVANPSTTKRGGAPRTERELAKAMREQAAEARDAVAEMVREDLKAAERDELVKKHGYKAMDYHE